MEDSMSKQPSEEPHSTRKRKRKTYSCLECRKRKLKCDREHPCGRCIKEGHPESCAFRSDGQHSGAEDNDVVNQDSPVLELGRSNALVSTFTTSRSHLDVGNGVLSPNDTASLQRKIASLEAKIAKLEASTQLPDKPQSSSPILPETETRFFNGTSFKTQFYGATNPTSLFAHFPEVVTTKDSKSKTYRISQAQQDLLTLRSRRKARKNREAPEVPTDLVSLLPSERIMQHMVQLYFDTYETTYRIVHKPTFWSEFSACPAKEWRQAFAAIVLAILATVSCVAVSELSFKDDFSSARVTAIKYMAAVDNWLNHQSAKHLNLEVFQVHMLSLLAKATNALSRKRAWANSGFLLRIAVSVGFHREPSHLGGKISTFDEEMRRRLWATMLEWDLFVSVARGLPPLAASIPTDSQCPLNVNDDEFDRDSQHLPRTQSLAKATDCSFLQVSQASLPLRTSLASLLNNPNIDLAWSDVLAYEDRLQQALEVLPPWARERKRFSAVLLDLQLRQYLLWIHAKQARGSTGPRTAYARMACVNASTEIVEMYLRLGDADVNALNMLRYDMYQCIITISLTLLSEAKNASIAWSLIDSLQPVCDKAFLILEDKVLKVGECYNHMWFASTSFASAQTALDPKMGEAKTIAIERIAKIYQKVFACQDPKPSSGSRVLPIVSVNGSSNNDSTSNHNLPTASWQTTPSASAVSMETPADYADILKNPSNEVLDFGTFPDWMADDFFNFDTAMI